MWTLYSDTMFGQETATLLLSSLQKCLTSLRGLIAAQELANVTTLLSDHLTTATSASLSTLPHYPPCSHSCPFLASEEHGHPQVCILSACSCGWFPDFAKQVTLSDAQ